MNIVKVATGLACGLTMLLLVLALRTEKSETALYNKTVEVLMEQEGTNSEQETAALFPVLVGIQADLRRIAHLSLVIAQKTKGAVQIRTEGEALHLEDYRQTVAVLQKNVRSKLSQLLAAYNKNQP